MNRPVEQLTLRKALRLTPDSRVAFTGAGGKTTAMFALAQELAAEHAAVIVTASTHLSQSQAAAGGRHVILQLPEALDQLEIELPAGILVFTGEAGTDGRVSGLNPGLLAQLDRFARSRHIPMLIEADGSKTRPLKAPAAHEPVVPDFVDTAVVVAGLSGLGKPLGGHDVHRPEIYSRISGRAAGEDVRPDDIVAVLCSPDGGLKGLPAGVSRVALLNQADDALLQSTASRMAEGLLGQYRTVLVAALGRGQGHVVSRHERIAAIVLAAGGSSRLGIPKQMLPWRGKPLIAHAVEQALSAGCAPVIVVTGSAGEQVSDALSGLPVRIVVNPDWSEGQSTSVKAGLAAVPPEAGGALFLLVDQPYVEAPLIRAVRDAHARSPAPITAPMIDDRRGNPVLFDRLTFPAFANLAGDVGGRPLFSRFPVNWVPWHDPNPLLDVDTMADYEALRGREAL